LIQRLQPFGPQNPEPVFLLRAVRLTGIQCVGAEKNHLRGQLGELPFIGFKLGDRKEMAINETVDVLATLNMNTFRDLENLQLQLKDLRLAV
jgi:single-stranded-DNA-specific exonuclease